MLDFRFDLSEVIAFVAEMQGAATVVKDELQDAMDASLSLLETLAVDETPVGATGHARQSITTRIRGEPPNFRGELVMGARYGMPLERGRKPGKWPPRAAIALWVRRKLQVSDDEVESVAFLIQRAIGQRGTSGAAMFYKAYEAGYSKVMRIWEEVPGRIVGRVLNG